MPVREVSNMDTLPKDGKVAIFFWASWHEPSAPGGQIDLVFSQLAELHGQELQFVKVEAESSPQISSNFNITVVPTILLLSESKTVKKVEGADVPTIVSAVENFSKDSIPTTDQNDTTVDIDSRLRKLVTASTVMLFMKGTPDEPRCKFSRQMVELLKDHKVKFGSFDILQDNTVREELKRFSNWPTFPQLYCQGNLIGGLDIVQEMSQEGPLRPQFETNLEPEHELPIEKRLHELVNRSPILLFMKGSPEAPRCGFSATIVEMLQAQGVAFDFFDILSDEEVRQGLKEFSQWPTYVRGELVGGLDIVKELRDSGELRSALSL